MPSQYRLALLLVAAAIMAGCASAGEINRLNAELDAANQRNVALLEAKTRYCKEMTGAAARVDEAKMPSTGSNVAGALLGGAIDWIAGKPVSTALRIFLPELFSGTAAPQSDVVAATRELSAGVSRYCTDLGARRAGAAP
jgi:hypothetical protein